MGAKSLRADINFAWPTSQIAVMGASGAVSIIHRKEIADAEDKDAKRNELLRAYEDTLDNPYVAAERGYIDRIILPSETRAEIIKALRALRNKRDQQPLRKHGNIPL
jgi:propionyl-CoA carboxylase beta chain